MVYWPAVHPWCLFGHAKIYHDLRLIIKYHTYVFMNKMLKTIISHTGYLVYWPAVHPWCLFDLPRTQETYSGTNRDSNSHCHRDLRSALWPTIRLITSLDYIFIYLFRRGSRKYWTWGRQQYELSDWTGGGANSFLFLTYKREQGRGAGCTPS